VEHSHKNIDIDRPGKDFYRLRESDCKEVLLGNDRWALMNELRGAGIEPYAWVLNKSVLAAGTSDPLLAARLAGECKQVERKSADMAKRIFTLPWRMRPPIGIVELSKLVRDPRRRRTCAE